MTSGRRICGGKDYAKADVTLNRALKLKPDSAETLLFAGADLFRTVTCRSTPSICSYALVRFAPENTDVIFLLARVSIVKNIRRCDSATRSRIETCSSALGSSRCSG